LAESFVDERDKPLRAVLVGVWRRGETRRQAEEHLEELAELVTTYGVPIAAQVMANAQTITATYLIGSGKVDEVKLLAEAHDADVIVVDDDLSGRQQQNWEKTTERAVIDRQEVILGIFADRAQTREAKLQVQLARAEYSLPRLRRAWSHLERQRGGGAFRGGSGEGQLETDRRLLLIQIEKLKADIQHVRQVRTTQRKARTVRPVPSAAIVGYTNAGKSSLLNAITGAGVLEEDKLFATLDPTTRRFKLPAGEEVLLTDTVGFIRKLPHGLVDAFRATLEEAEMGDVLLHVVDASHPNAMDHLKAAEAVLTELNVISKVTILVLNKIDLVEDLAMLSPFYNNREHVVQTSTKTGVGLDQLGRLLSRLLPADMEPMSLRLPPSRSDLIAMLHREARIRHSEYEESDFVVEALIPRRLKRQYEPYAIDTGTESA
jgi:GTP-binding protein HflX